MARGQPWDADLSLAVKVVRCELPSGVSAVRV